MLSAMTEVSYSAVGLTLTENVLLKCAFGP